MIGYVVAIVAIAFLFDFINGFHDSANSIATIVGTRVLNPLAAVVWAATFNFAALFTGGVAVAKAVGGGMIEQSIVDPHVILGGGWHFDTGRFIDFKTPYTYNTSPQIPFADVLVSLANAMGVPLTTFGRSDWCRGPLAALRG